MARKKDDEDTPAWRQAQDIKALPVKERIWLAVHNSQLGASNLNEQHVQEVKDNVRPTA